MNNKWNLNKLEKQATNNQDFDNYILEKSEVLKYKNVSVLDIGCSNGFKTKMLFDKYENISNIYGIDIDENAIKEAKNTFKDNSKYNFKLMNIDDLDSKKKYDIIYLSYVLQHLKDPSMVLKKLRQLLSDRGVIIIKVPDDSFKICYPDEECLLNKIFNIYENEIMKRQGITKFIDRYIGKKVYSYLKENNYKNIQLYHSITDTINKTIEEKLKLFESSIAFRNADDKENIPQSIKDEISCLLSKLKEKFKNNEFYYTMTVLYYIAHK